MNEILTERFGRSRSAFKPDFEKAQVWILPQRLNEQVRQYFDEPQTPTVGGEWVERSEIPTSEEILDEDTSSTDGSTGGSSEVLLVPNKKKGTWESKGMSAESSSLKRYGDLTACREISQCSLRASPRGCSTPLAGGSG